jgi:transposase
MSKKKRKNYSREFKMEAVGLITEKGYSIAEASRNLGIDYSVLRRWKNQFVDDSQKAFPGKGRLKAPDEELRKLKRELERVTEERDILKKALAYFAEDQK